MNQEQANQGNGQEKLWAAYAQAYAKIENVTKNAHNPHFGSNYADLAAVNDTIKPIFAEFGLSLLQCPGRLVEVGGKLAVEIVNVLAHTSGQNLVIGTQMPLGDKPTAQNTVAAVTYGRRTAAAGIGGIAQVDDDGNEASGRGRGGGKKAAADADALLAQIAGFDGTAEQLEAALAPAVQELNEETVATAFKAKRRELRGKKK